MAIDYTVLKNECQTNPNNYTDNATGLTLAQAYTAEADLLCVEILNKVRNGISISRSDVTAQEILEAIDTRDLASNANVLQGSWFESFTQQVTSGIPLLKPNGNDTRIMSNLLRIMVNTNGSETRLRALASRNGSRAEQLFGEFTRLTDRDIIATRNV